MDSEQQLDSNFHLLNQAYMEKLKAQTKKKKKEA